MDYRIDSKILTKRAILVCLAILTFLSGNVCAQQDWSKLDWQLEKEKNGIKIFSSTITDSKYRAIRSYTIAKTSVTSAVALVTDLDACSTWADLCEKTELVDFVSDTESFIYTYNNVPFPVKDRDVVSHVIWSFDVETGKASMISKAVVGWRPLLKKVVRITQAEAQWHFTPYDDQHIIIENFAHINPAGPTPSWLINLLQVGSPFKTMTNMRAVLESGQYQNSQVEFIPVVIAD